MSQFKRRLVTIAVPDAAGSTAFQDGVEAQVAAVEAWWGAPELGDRTFAVDRVGAISSRRDLETALHDTGLRGLGEADVVLLYLTGHGRGGASGRHYLVLPDTAHGRLPGQAYPTLDVVAAVLDSDVRHLLVVVNSCFSGLLDAELAALRKDLLLERRELASLSVFTSADFDEMPRVREFAELLERVRQWLCTRAQYSAPYLTFDEFEKELVDAARREPRLLEPRRVWRAGPSSEPSPCLPNPGYQPPEDVVAPPLRQIASSAAELDYWLDRASGRLSRDDPGWYFAGRRDLTGQVSRFLRDGRGTLIVTGAAGTGKSAIIARAVTLSDPGFLADPRYRDAVAATPPDTVPPPGAIDVAVLARNKDVDEIVDQIMVALERAPVESNKPQHLREVLEREPGVRTIAVDGVDEARNPALLVVDVLGPLARLTGHDGYPKVRLVAGVRSTTRVGSDGAAPELVDLVRQSVGEVTELRTDGTEAASAVAEYVEALLGERDAAQRSELASVIAERVAPSFLDARLAGQRLRETAVPQRSDDPQWLASLDEGTIGLLRQDLLDAATPPHSAHELLAVLQAAAYAQGAGIPWADIWPVVASAVLGPPMSVPDAAIDHVVGGRLCGYLARDSEDGRGVYRPAHERLAQVLRDEPERILDGSPVTEGRVPHGRIAEQLSEHARLTTDLPPHPYLRRHLADHAALGGVLDDQVVFPGFVPWDTSGHLRGLLGLPITDTASKTGLSAWARIEPFLGDADLPSREVSLRFSRVAGRTTAAAEPVSDAYRTIALRPRWAHWSLLGNVMASHTSAVLALAATAGPDRSALLATADQSGTVQVWDPATGRAVGAPLPGDATALAGFTGADGRALLAIGGRRGVVRVWDPATGRLAGKPMLGHTSSINALHAFADGDRTLLASASQDHTVRIWNPVTGAAIGEPLTGHTGGVRAVTAFTGHGGRVRLATGSWDETIRVWSAATGLPVGQPMTGHVGAVNTVLAFAVGAGKTLLATGGADTTVRIWDPDSSSQVAKLAGDRGGGAHAVTGFLSGHEPRLATVNLDATVQVWDVRTGAPLGEPLAGDTRWIYATETLTSRDGRLLLAAGARDGTVRLWALDQRLPDERASGTGPVDGINSVVDFRASGGRRLLAGVSDEGRVRIWDPATGDLVRTLTGHRMEHWAVAAFTGPDGRALLATGANSPAIRVWDPETGEVVRQLAGHTSGVQALIVVGGDTREPRLVSGSRDGTVRVWDPVAGTQVGGPLTGHVDWVSALAAFVTDAGQRLLVSGGDDYVLRVWDLDTGAAVREMTGHRSAVTAVAAFGGPGRVLLASGNRGEDLVRIWNPSTGEQAGSLPGHPGGVTAIAAFTGPQRQPLLATGGADRAVRIWDLAARRELIRLVVAAPLHSLRVVRAAVTGGRSAAGYLVIGGSAGCAVVEVTPGP